MVCEVIWVGISNLSAKGIGKHKNKFLSTISKQPNDDILSIGCFVHGYFLVKYNMLTIPYTKKHCEWWKYVYVRNCYNTSLVGNNRTISVPSFFLHSQCKVFSLHNRQPKFHCALDHKCRIYAWTGVRATGPGCCVTQGACDCWGSLWGVPLVICPSESDFSSIKCEGRCPWTACEEL